MGKKILLADDSITIQKVIELTFSDEDFEVVTVGNGRLAIEKVQDVRPDIVLCDIIMPEKDGYEVCDFVKKQPSLAHVPVLLLTGAFEPFDQERAARVGCDGFLAKPFEPQTLIAKVKDLLAQTPGRRGAPPVSAMPPARPPAPPAAAAPTPFREAPLPAPVPAVAPAPPPPPAAPTPPPPPVQASGFEAFYPTPEELEPLTQSPEFEPVFSSTDFEPIEEFESVEATPPDAAFEGLPVPPAAPAADSTVTFIPEEPFTDDTVEFERQPQAAAPATPPGEDLWMFTPEEAPGAAAQPEAETWVESPTIEIPLEERARVSVESAYPGTPPQGFEDAFEVPKPGPAAQADQSAAPAFGSPVEEAFGFEPVTGFEGAGAGAFEAPPASFEAAATFEEWPSAAPQAQAAPEIEPLEVSFETEPGPAAEPAAAFTADTGERLGAAEPAPITRAEDLIGELAPQAVASAEPLPGWTAEAIGSTFPSGVASAPAVPVEARPAEEEMPSRLEEEVSFEGLAGPEPPETVPPSEAAAVAVPVDMVQQIAQRVVGQLSEKVIREIAWEVIPELAEALIKKEIERLKAELQQLP